MATTAGYKHSEIHDRGKRWFGFWQLDTPERLIAASQLNARGYGFAAPPAKGGKDAPAAISEAARGEQLFGEFATTMSGKQQTATTRTVDSDAEQKAEDSLRGWLRCMHGEVVGIRREEAAPALRTLQTLGELATLSGLDGSARAMLGFLDTPAVGEALAAYHIGKADHGQGQKLYDAWWTARGKASGARSGVGTANKSQREGREAFDGWLNKWWAIATVRLADHPAILSALGVESKRRAAGIGVASAGNSDADGDEGTAG